MHQNETRIPVHLRGEGIVIEATHSAVNCGKRKRPVWRETLRWQCPCGKDIDTATTPKEMIHDVTGGYVLECPGCGRWYMHHCGSGYIEG
jgi:hypothetical protein